MDSVVVFVDRARVTRDARGALRARKAAAVFEHLPDALDTRTLRGEARDAGGGDRPVPQSTARPSRAIHARPRSRPSAQGRGRDPRRGGRPRHARGGLERLGAYAGILGATLSEEMRNPKPNTSLVGQRARRLRARRAALEAERRKAESRSGLLRRDQDRVARELGHLGAAPASAARAPSRSHRCRGRRRSRPACPMSCRARRGGPSTISDFTPAGRGKGGPARRASRWAPSSASRPARTGRTRASSLSTARPKLGAEAPLPAPSSSTGTRRSGTRSSCSRRNGASSSEGGGAGARRAHGRRVDDKGNAFVLTLPHRRHHLPDGRPSGRRSTSRDPGDHQAVPRPSWTSTSTGGRAQEPCAYPLLDGRMRSYRGGSYVGDAAFAYRGVGEPMEVSLGIDEEFKVERKTLDERDQSRGSSAPPSTSSAPTGRRSPTAPAPPRRSSCARTSRCRR